MVDLSGPTKSSTPLYLTNVSGTLFFSASDGVHGPGLWKSDGTAGGTVLVSSASPSNLTNLNGSLLFTANDGVHGKELWQSDGTTAGTVLVGDIVPGSGSSNPTNLANVNGVLYFRADDGIHGTELWKFIPLLLGDINGDGQRTMADVVALMSALANPTPNQLNQLASVADVNNDGHVNNLDIQSLLCLLANDAAAAGGGGAVPVATADSRAAAPSSPAANLPVESGDAAVAGTVVDNSDGGSTGGGAAMTDAGLTVALPTATSEPTKAQAQSTGAVQSIGFANVSIAPDTLQDNFVTPATRFLSASPNRLSIA